MTETVYCDRYYEDVCLVESYGIYCYICDLGFTPQWEQTRSFEEFKHPVLSKSITSRSRYFTFKPYSKLVVDCVVHGEVPSEGVRKRLFLREGSDIGKAQLRLDMFKTRVRDDTKINLKHDFRGLVRAYKARNESFRCLVSKVEHPVQMSPARWREWLDGLRAGVYEETSLLAWYQTNWSLKPEFVPLGGFVYMFDDDSSGIWYFPVRLGPESHLSTCHTAAGKMIEAAETTKT